jgi:hypothetical protein
MNELLIKKEVRPLLLVPDNQPGNSWVEWCPLLPLPLPTEMVAMLFTSRLVPLAADDDAL